MAKRIFDVAFAAIALLTLSPLLGVVALAIKLDSRGPALYFGPRIGKDGIPFRICKFRSMVADAEERGPDITRSGDTRITRLGRVLRRTKLDELPQLLNVLKGDMSFVGPRPEAPDYVELYTSDQRRVLSVRPGITSLASVEFRDEQSELQGEDWHRKYVEQVMPRKLALDLQYLDQCNFWRDVSLILRTLLAIGR